MELRERPSFRLARVLPRAPEAEVIPLRPGDERYLELGCLPPADDRPQAS